MSAPAAAVKVAKSATFWRLAGMTYLDQLNVATTALRKVMKEPARTEALGKSQFRYREFNYADGKELAPGPSLAGPHAVAGRRKMLSTCGSCTQRDCACVPRLQWKLFLTSPCASDRLRHAVCRGGAGCVPRTRRGKVRPTCC